jgi:hypothetical protein
LGRNKPQWQALGVALTFCTILGGLAYWPIQTATTDLKASVLVITQKMVTQKAMEWRTARSAEDRLRRDNAVKDLREALVPRQELYRVLSGYRQQVEDQQRQIDEIRLDLKGDTGGQGFSGEHKAKPVGCQLRSVVSRRQPATPRSGLTVARKRNRSEIWSVKRAWSNDPDRERKDSFPNFCMFVFYQFDLQILSLPGVGVTTRVRKLQPASTVSTKGGPACPLSAVHHKHAGFCEYQD